MDLNLVLEQARGFLDLKMWGEAEEVIESLSEEAKSSPPVLGLKIQIYWESGRFELMAASAEALRDAEPDQAVHWLSLASARRHAFGLEAGRAVLEEAKIRFPADADILFSLACYESEMGEIEKAKTTLGAAFEINPDLRMHALDAPELAAIWESFSGT